MSPLIPFLILLCVSAYASPEAGILQLYNFSGAVVVPELDGKPLVAGVIPDRQASSALLVSAGSHEFRIKRDDAIVARFTFQLEDRESITLALTPMGVWLMPKVKERNALLVMSCSDQKHLVTVAGQAFTLLPRQRYLLKEVKSGSISFDGGKKHSLVLEEAPSHTLILWPGETTVPEYGLIPNFIHSVPESLRPDFTFGRKRSEIKGLKTITPEVEK